MPAIPRSRGASVHRARVDVAPAARPEGRAGFLRHAAVLLLASAALLGACARPPPVEPADLVVTNGRVVTLDEPAEVQAIAARGSRIVAVGSVQEIDRYIGANTDVVDVAGQLVIPGFVEAHGHFAGIGRARLQLNLMDVRSWEEIATMVEHAAARAAPGEWILGRGWHQEKWDAPPADAVEGFPTHEALSRAAPDNPVMLTHASGHAAIANAKAMDVSGIGPSTPDPPGGDLLRDSRGRPTGLLRETAESLVRVGAGERPRTAAEDLARARRVFELASEEVVSKGITSFHDAGATFAEVDLMREMVDEGAIQTRLWVMLRADNDALAANLARYREIDRADGFLTVRGIKKSIDGALGSRGAWLLEPYADAPHLTGHNTATVEDVRETARLALAHEYQLCVHAIGDRANRETLDIFARAFAGGDGKALRWRIEHAQHLRPDDVPRFGRLGVIASMQGIHCTSDAPFVLARLGPRRAEEGAYVWRSLLRGGAVIANGTDAPVEDVNPIASYHALVSRRVADGSVFYPDQRLSRVEALRASTLDAAYAAFEETTRGSIARGKYADMVVLSRDILTVAEEEIADAEVRLTVVGGKVRFRR